MKSPGYFTPNLVGCTWRVSLQMEITTPELNLNNIDLILVDFDDDFTI